MKKNCVVQKPQSLGWLEYKLNPQEMDYVWRCIDNKKGHHNNNLAGNIDSSYLLLDRGDWFFTNTVAPLIDEYTKEIINIGERLPTTMTHPYTIQEWWVNYQKQNEFNPLHDHTGVYSFVIWMKIPFSWKEQNKKRIARQSNDPKISTFQFIFSDMLGEMMSHNYSLSSEDEGLMLLFPSKLHHQVYPFYDCDEDRISVSGNIKLNTARRM
jgi:hypothetical protein